MSTREKQAWFALVTTLLLWPYYFVVLASSIVSGVLDGWALLEVFLWTLGIHVVLLLGLAVIVTRLTREDFDAPPDELERMIEARADKMGLRVLEPGIAVVAIASLWISDFARDAFTADPGGATAILMANAIIVVGMLAGLAREAVLIVQFRRTGVA